MTTQAASHDKPASRRWHRLALFIVIGNLLAISGTAQARGFGSPDECQAYSGDAHVKCLYAYIEAQQKRLAQIEDAIHGQSGDVDQLRPQVDRQAALPQEIPQSVTGLTQASAYSYPSVAPGYAYAGYGYRGVPYGYPAYGAAFGLSLYPGLGLSLGFGGPGYYGRPFFAPRYIYRSPGFFRPRFSYGPRIHVGPRFYPGPRYYSRPRSFGHRSFGHHR